MSIALGFLAVTFKKFRRNQYLNTSIDRLLNFNIPLVNFWTSNWNILFGDSTKSQSFRA